MVMRDEDVRDALRGLIPAPLESRIAGEERVDQDDLVGEVEAKCTVSEPGALPPKKNNCKSKKRSIQ
jgi:hypothetical protein